MFEKDVLPKIGGRKIKDIGKRDIRFILERIEARAPNQALQVYRRLSRLFNYAASKDIIEISPMANLDPIGRQSKKDRYLTFDEIKIFLTRLPVADMAPNTAAALELILRTGQRPSEVIGTHRDEIQGDWWIIPGGRTKNGREHRVPLTERIKSLFGEANEHGFYFPSLKNAGKPIGHTILSKALRRSLTGQEKRQDTEITIPIDPFTPHDLRRSCATGLAGLKFTNEVIGALLNHKNQTVTGIYNQYQYDPEKLKAIKSWERKLEIIVAGKLSGQVISFGSAAI
jgi:integrase